MTFPLSNESRTKLIHSSFILPDPTKKANVVIQTALAKLANLTASQLPSEFKFLDGYTFFGFEVDALTDFGRKE